MRNLTCGRGLLTALKWFAGSLVAAGCSGQTTAACKTGNEGCSCYDNDTCNAALTCASHLCVNLNTGGNTAASSSGGAVAMGGGSSNSGGAPLSGGNGPTGGVPTTGTVTSTGGMTANGGAMPTGGAPFTGGTWAAGGTVTTSGAQTGGVGASGGVLITGGTWAAGGTVMTGGKSAMGGSHTGGNTATPDAGTGGSSGQVADCSSQLSQTLTQCSDMQIEPLAATGNVLLVLDASGSMQFPMQSEDTVTKWSSLRSALTQTLGSAPSDLHFGLELFPYDPNGPIAVSSSAAVACQVPNGSSAIAVEIISSTSNNQTIESILASFTPAGGTPTAEALRQAYAYFTVGNGSSLIGPKWVVLVTDGGPNCNMNLTCNSSTCTQNMDCKCAEGCGTTLNCCQSSGSSSYGYICLDDIAVTSAIDQLTLAGIHTFVVGLAGSEPYANVLDTFALAGGVPNPDGPNYYAVAPSSGTAGIEQALQSIVARAGSSCDVPLTTVPSNLAQVNVAVDCTVIAQSSSGGTTVNWSIDTAQSPAYLRLGAAACDAEIQANGAGLQLVTGCPTVTGN